VVANLPDLILEGHTDIAAYALDWSPTKPIIASGGSDKKIYLWNVEDHF
jgi:WD40 repeat protein